MHEPEPQFDYPVNLGNALGVSHRVSESMDYDGDRFDCSVKDAYTHTGGWPTWDFCPFCGVRLDE